MKYIANPVEVDAYKIEAILALAEHPILQGQFGRATGVVLALENREIVDATPEMTARMEPKVGDYWVIQADGYIYLNPKDVFERKYRVAQPEETAKTATIEIFSK